MPRKLIKVCTSIINFFSSPVTFRSLLLTPSPRPDTTDAINSVAGVDDDDVVVNDVNAVVVEVDSVEDVAVAVVEVKDVDDGVTDDVIGVDVCGGVVDFGGQFIENDDDVVDPRDVDATDASLSLLDSPGDALRFLRFLLGLPFNFGAKI